MSKSSISVLAKSIAKKSGISQEDAENFIRQMFEVADKAISEDKMLRMRWLGTFKVASIKDRESIDVNTGERILIEGRDKISFTPDNVLKDIVNKPFAQFETVVVNDGVDFTDIDEKFAAVTSEENLPKETANEETGRSVELESSAKDADPASSVIVIPSATESKDSTTGTDGFVVVDDETSKHEEVVADEVVTKLGIVSEKKTAEQENVVAEETAPVSLSQLEEHPLEHNDEPTEDTATRTSEVTEDIAQVQTDMVGKGDAEGVAPVEATPTDVTPAKAASTGTAPVDATPAKAALTGTAPADATPAKAASTGTAPVDATLTKVAAGSAPEETASDIAEKSTDKHHLVIPKYWLAIVAVLFIALMGGMAWLAFNYGKMQAQRDQMAVQIEKQKVKPAVVKKPVAKPKVDSTQIVLQEKAKQDSLRLAEASDAVKLAEKAEKVKDTKDQSEGKSTEMISKNTERPKQQDITNKYDGDARVRTGAYRITGIDRTVTAKEGQTLESISKQLLGPGMECYVEAVNGGNQKVKAGQKIKIPKLELKKKGK